MKNGTKIQEGHFSPFKGSKVIVSNCHSLPPPPAPLSTNTV